MLALLVEVGDYKRVLVGLGLQSLIVFGFNKNITSLL